MGATSALELPIELKQEIERVAKERNEDPASLLASAMDSLLSAEEAHLVEVRRRDRLDSGERDSHYTNEDAVAKLDSLRPSRRNAPPK
jgi:predicted transcriptional regulator